MDTDLLRSFDAWIGRLVDFASADPLRREAEVKVPAPPPAAEVRRAPPKRPRKRPAARKTAAKKTAAKKSKPPVPRKTAAPGTVEGKVLDALAALGGAASMKELAAETGEARSALLASLDKLTGDGRVRRVGAGLKTRYERTGTRP